MRLRQVNGSPEIIDQTLSIFQKDYPKYNAKYQYLVELLEEIINERGEKAIIFTAKDIRKALKNTKNNGTNHNWLMKMQLTLKSNPNTLHTTTRHIV